MVGDYARRGCSRLGDNRRALAEDGELRLWSGDVAIGAPGAAFVDEVAEVCGADVAAADRRVGAAALGGSWKISRRAGAAMLRAPLTDIGVASYPGILSFEVKVTGSLPIGDTTRNITYFIIDASKKTIVGQVNLPDAVRQPMRVSISVKVQNALGAFAIGTFNNGEFESASFLSVNDPAAGASPRGAIGSF